MGKATPAQTPPTECRLLIDPPGDGAWNMAVDETLLEWAARENACCWRFYQWREPTLSLGYFQEYGQRGDHPASRGCPVVRRLTGGGAILHDAELTYSVVLPVGHPLAARRESLYAAAHESLVETLAGFGVAASLCRPAGRRPGREPLLCFQRRARGDVLVGAIKVAGSAQRRRRGAVLQHGSVLLRRSPAAPELPALEDVAQGAFDADALARAWLPRLAQRLAVAWAADGRSPEEERRAAELAQCRYACPEWTQRRGR